MLRDWVARANVELVPGRRFGRGRTVVVEEAATWRDAETGEKVGEATVATAFSIVDGLAVGIARHDGLEEALEYAGLGFGDETPDE